MNKLSTRLMLASMQPVYDEPVKSEYVKPPLSKKELKGRKRRLLAKKQKK